MKENEIAWFAIKGEVMSRVANRHAVSLRSLFKAGTTFLPGVATLFLILAPATVLRAQTATGNIVGRVTDNSGAVIAGAQVTALNPEKGLTFHTVTDQEGMYRFYYLAPATYTLTVTQPGFSTVERPGVQLQSNESPEVDIQLQVGAPSGGNDDRNHRLDSSGQGNEHAADHAAVHLDDDVPYAGCDQHERVPYRWSA
jgi:hypothetical protein